MNSNNIAYFREMIKGMDSEELTAIAEMIPVELCFNRVGKELQKAKTAINSIKQIQDTFQQAVNLSRKEETPC